MPPGLRPPRHNDAAIIPEDFVDDDDATVSIRQQVPPHQPTSLSEEREAHALSFDQSIQPYLTSQVAAERSLMFSSGSRNSPLQSLGTDRAYYGDPFNSYTQSVTRSRRTTERVRKSCRTNQ